MKCPCFGSLQIHMHIFITVQVLFLQNSHTKIVEGQRRLERQKRMKE